VLGWTAPPSTSSRHRQSVVCAGILPTNQFLSLQEYQSHLAKLRDTISEAKPKLCACLVDSLEIVAYFAAKGDDENDPSAKSTKNENLPVISIRKGYPWWWNEEDLSEENSTTMSMHRQVLYYNQNQEDSTDPYAHWSSEHCNNDRYWRQLLLQLSHAREILEMIQTGNIVVHESKQPQPPQSPPQSPRQRGTTSESTEYPPKEDSTDDSEGASSWKRIQDFVLTQSLTLLHLQQRWRASSSREDDSILSIIPLFQCLRIYRTMSSSPKADDRVCSGCGRAALLACKPLAAKRVVAEWDHLLTAALDTLWGIGTAILLLLILRFAPSIVGDTLLEFKRMFVELLQDYIAWLETFPAGFKLNVKLTANMGHEIQNLVVLHQQWMEATLWNAQVWQDWLGPALALVAALGGWNAFLALCIDMSRLESLHVTALMLWFRTIYRAELYLLGGFGRLFRGKKRNILRQRTDSMEYDAMQLLVGTIGFSICIFLWTTLMVYYTFFVVWNIFLHLPVILVWVVYVLSRSIPWGSLVWRLRKGGWFTENVYIQTQQDSEVMHVSWMFPVARSPVSIVGSCVFAHLKPLLQWLVNFCLEVLSPRSSNKSPCTMPFVSLLQEFQSHGRS
jgi:hypothetical protein